MFDIVVFSLFFFLCLELYKSTLEVRVWMAGLLYFSIWGS